MALSTGFRVLCRIDGVVFLAKNSYTRISELSSP